MSVFGPDVVAAYDEISALRERPAAAEQRASDAEARAERLAAVLEETYHYLIWLRKPAGLPDSRWPFTCQEADLDAKIRAALTAATTQPDERTAAAQDMQRGPPRNA